MATRRPAAPKTVTKTTGEVKPTEEALKDDTVTLVEGNPEASVDLVQDDEGDLSVVNPSDADKRVKAGVIIGTSGRTDPDNSVGPHLSVKAQDNVEIEILVGGFFLEGRSLPAGAKVSVPAKFAAETKAEQIASYGKQMFRAV